MRTFLGVAVVACALAPATARAICTFPNGCHGQLLDGECDCEGATVPCSVCGRSGTASCTPECTVAPGSCSALSAEICNNCDDDQDGHADNAVPNQTAPLARSCADPTGNCAGTQTCSSGQWGGCTSCSSAHACTNACGQSVAASCNPTTCQFQGCPAPPEVCNGLDDDCDGDIDDNVCRQDGDCTCSATTCTQLGRTCGTASDGCGGTQYCGTCQPGSTCASGTCCQLATCQAGSCGTISNGCGGTLSCGNCASGICRNNQCCVPATCAELGYHCGTWPDFCGGTIQCGTCAGKCCDGLCTSLPPGSLCP